MKLSPSFMSRTWPAPIASAPMATIAIGSATGREAATRATNIRHGAVPCSRASSGVRRIAVTGRVIRSSRPASGPRRVSGPGSLSGSAPGRGGSLSVRSGSRLACSAAAAPSSRTRLPNRRFPNSAISAGTSVIATTMLMTVVSARPGPNARKNSSLPATSAAVPAATMRPAVKTIGATSTTVPRAAATRGSPWRMRLRMPDRKKIV